MMKDKNPSPGAGEKKGGMSDSEQLKLLLCAREGNEEAFAELVHLYTPMLRAAAAQYSSEVSAQDLEELSQEALLAFHRAVMRYDPLRGEVKFGLYAKVCVNKALISALRKISRNKKYTEYIPVDDAHDIADTSPADSLIEYENERSLRRLINENLSDYERTVWWLYYAGADAAHIAEQTGRSKRSAENAITRVRRKLRALITQSGTDK